MNKIKNIMGKTSGQLIKLSDGRMGIIYNDQPLFKQGKIVINLVNDDYTLILDDNGKPKILVKGKAEYEELMKDAKLIGFVD